MEIEDISQDVYFAFGEDWATVYYQDRAVQKFRGSDSFDKANQWTDEASEYWNNEDGWGHKSTATVFEDKNYNLPLDGEWVEIYINEPVGEHSA